MDVAIAFALLAALAVVVGREQFSPGETVAGVARIADGDTVVVAGERIRLEGIDAPELSQTCLRAGSEWPCGIEARDALQRLAGQGAVSCHGGRRDRYGRLVARCTAGQVDLGGAMVEEGWAVAYGGYGAAEADARAAGRGMWAGSFDRPQEWRRVHGELAEEPHGGLLAWLAGVWRAWVTN